MPASSPGLARRSDAVLLIIDVQERLAAVMSSRDAVTDACVRLARTAALVGVPIVATRQYPQGLGPTEAAIESVLLHLAEEGATVLGVDKTTFDCTVEPEFVDALGATTRRQAIIAGMETHICVTQTALSLVARGFEVQVVADGCCSRDRAMHDVALDRLRAAGVGVTTSESAMYELVGRAATDEFRALLAIVKG
jgi:nicotinamidase-related amidase